MYNPYARPVALMPVTTPLPTTPTHTTTSHTKLPTQQEVTTDLWYYTNQERLPHPDELSTQQKAMLLGKKPIHLEVVLRRYMVKGQERWNPVLLCWTLGARLPLRWRDEKKYRGKVTPAGWVLDHLKGKDDSFR